MEDLGIKLDCICPKCEVKMSCVSKETYYCSSCNNYWCWPKEDSDMDLINSIIYGSAFNKGDAQ
jgi:hypothetical protein